MILIISTSNDITTYDVIDWLKSQNKDYILIKDIITFTIESLIISNEKIDFTFYHKEQKIVFSEIESIWYRRGEFNIDALPIILRLSDNLKVFQKSIHNHLINEENEIIELLNFLILQKSHINSPLKHNSNKLITLMHARNIGLNIPYTLVTSYKSLLIKEAEKRNLITKSIRNNPSLTNSNKEYWTLTNELETNKIYTFNEHFYPSLIQEKIEKLFEVRSFYINNSVYSMAIFSQSNVKTNLDFRNYDNKKPNRNVPFKLPKLIESKLLKLTKLVGINCGSIDFIYGLDKNYYFLEINPIGQFGSLSYQCNYNLEKEIAFFLHEKK